ASSWPPAPVPEPLQAVSMRAAAEAAATIGMVLIRMDDSFVSPGARYGVVLLGYCGRLTLKGRYMWVTGAGGLDGSATGRNEAAFGWSRWPGERGLALLRRRRPCLRVSLEHAAA